MCSLVLLRVAVVALTLRVSLSVYVSVPVPAPVSCWAWISLAWPTRISSDALPKINMRVEKPMFQAARLLTGLVVLMPPLVFPIFSHQKRVRHLTLTS